MLYKLFFNDPATVADANIYFQAAIQAFKTNHDSPVHAAVVLLKMMEAYRDSKAVYNTRTHIEDAIECISRLKKLDEAGLQSAINYLIAIQAIEPAGEFALLLNTFITIYPQRMIQSSAITKLKTTQDMWASCVDKFHNQNTDIRTGNLFNLLPRFGELVAVIPNDRLDAYMNAIMSILNSRDYSNLYLGWACSAAGLLCGRVNSDKKNVIRRKLSEMTQETLQQQSEEIIGLTEALLNSQAVSSSFQAASAALFRYFTEHTAKILSNIKDKDSTYRWGHHTQHRYFQKLFPLMLRIMGHYNHEQYETIFFHLMKADNLYPCRQWIDLLHEYISLEQLEDLRKKVDAHPHQQELNFTFYYWLHDHNFEAHRRGGTYVTKERGDQCLRSIDAILAANYDFNLPIKFLFEVRGRESRTRYMAPELFETFEKNLIRIVAASSEKDRQKLPSRLESMYEAIPLLIASQGMKLEQKLSLAKNVYESALLVQSANGILMAITMDPRIIKQHYDAIVYHLIKHLQSDESDQTGIFAREALKAVVANCDVNQLPVLMTRLASINSFSARAALCETHQAYLACHPRLSQQNRPGH